jgi:hypothetical protein
MTCERKYIRCVITVGSHMTNYFDNKIVIVKNNIDIKPKIHY